jgi:ribosomal protein L40E
VYASLDEQIAALAKGLAQRTDFLRRFTQRRRDSEPGMATRLALQVLRHAASTQVALSGLSAAASALAASESPEEVSRTAQRLASWLHFRLRDAAKRAGTNIELSGSVSGTAAARFLRLSTETPRESAGGLQASSPRHTPGFSLPTSGDRGLEWRLGEEASLHSLATDAVALLDPSAERLTLAGVVTLLASALESLPVGALQLKVALKRCGTCGAANPSDASSCRSCGAASFRAMPVEPGLFEAHA